jgi:23S rRNA (guanine745-N1)-methyltransferase
MPNPPLACTVRACGLPLQRDGARFVCARAHAFDIARKGYVSLLQPQDRRAADPGDARGAVEARQRLAALGAGDALQRALLELAARRLPAASRVAIELGSGTGDLLGAIAGRLAVDCVGIDLSTTAAAAAARRFPDVVWVVANADRRLPLLDASAGLALSSHSRRNPAECARVLIPNGVLIVAVPAADDLIELREAAQGAAVTRDRSDALIAEHAADFQVLERTVVRDRRHFPGEGLRDLLRATYRGGRRSAAARAGDLEALDVTLASDVVVFGRR